MGAFEIHASEDGSGKEMRQVSTNWPNCWNSADCDPPKVWFGPEQWNDDFGLSATVNVKLADSGNITLSLAPYITYANLDALEAASVTLCTNGSWRVGSTSLRSGLNLTTGQWQQVQLTRSRNFISARVGGVLLANESVPKTGPGSDQRNFTLKVMLSHYYVAHFDDFMLEAA